MLAKKKLKKKTHTQGKQRKQEEENLHLFPVDVRSCVHCEKLWVKHISHSGML